ncbi:TonB-dependent receptor, plug [Psychromonas ingrahamii 37]|uniref:TonB-dependent receptor, plug n=1 Tax=Psychromonas ingrahamii (strain DSM 17664 / CCUG 51855 / 37) TaxID=357804 RepID=A1SZW2_PSYIN|nr:TonB-dependent receptor [Psychromonas ingrahamii]ABM05027.1 TonB-dependent receptor, plug [Psychromonas ingrahamii 37]
MPRLYYTPIAFALTTLFSATSIAAAPPISEQDTRDDIVISASRVETKRIESGSSVTVLDEQYIKENQARTVAELLQDVPGVSVASNGGLGQATSVFIRGANSNQTLVIIDGIEVNNLGNFEGGYDFAYLMADNIERIEVLKGSQSALWGSDAMGGVINIITKKGKAGFHPTASIEVGGNNYHKENVTLSAAQGNSHYSLSASNMKTDGISATDTDPDDDGYKNQSVSLKAGHQFTDIFSMDTVLRYNDAETEYDSGYTTNSQRQAKLSSHLNLLNNQWKNRLSVAFSDSNTEDFSSWGDSKYEGKKIKTDLQSDYYISAINGYTQRISFLAEHESDKYQSLSMTQDERIEASGVVLGYGVDWAKTIFVNVAVRSDFNNKFDDTTTYHIDTSVWVNDGTRLHASHGTGLKNPNLGQLYGENASWGYVGNADLKPEKSRSWDAGVEYNFVGTDAYIDLTYFDSLYTDMHTWSGSFPNSTYINLNNKATARGIEFTGKVKVSNKLRVNTGYTYMETNDGNGNELARRPKHAASINANYKYTPELSANIGARYVGKRLDSDDSTLSSYTVVNISTAYQIQEHITLSARIENALDKDYQEVSGFNTDPLTAYIGFSFK